MKKSLTKIITFILLLSFSVIAQNINSSENAKVKSDNEPVPILVLFEFGVWTKVSGTDMPDFVLYDDGTVIYDAAKKAGAFRYVTAKLSADEMSGIMEKINAPEFENYKNGYSTCDECYTSDLPSPFLMLRRKDGTYKTVATYGSLSSSAEPLYRVQNIPQSLVFAFYYLSGYEHPKAETWRADFIEVIVWKYDGESKKNVKWDKSLPDLTDAKTVSFKKSDTQYYSLFVPESSERKLANTFYKLRRSKGALLMNNQRWNLTYRFPFPSERVWLAGKDGKIFRDEQ
jgi:hypothetical protein